MPYSHHQFKRWRLLLNAKERAKYKPKFKGTVRDRKVVARVWAKAKTTDPSLQCSRWAAEFGLDPGVVLSELAPVLHVNTFQQERGDSFSCGIWAT
jgi:hypothetical protein